jgi:hypothetical protein
MARESSNAVFTRSLTHKGPEILNTSHIHRKDGLISAEHKLFITLISDYNHTDFSIIVLILVLLLREVIGNHTIANANPIFKDLALDLLNIGYSFETFVVGVQLRFSGL